MKFRIESVVQELIPWELIIERAGRDWPTRRPNVATLLRLSEPRAISDELAQEIAEEIFAAPAPRLAEWEREHVTAAISAYLAYFQAVMGKNSLSIAARAKAAVEKQMTTPASA